VVAAEAGRVTGIGLSVGDEVADGSQLVRINGRPAVAVSGGSPFWRPLSEGSAGPDVSQLQEILAAAGFDAPVTGAFDAATRDTLRQWQADRGFPEPDGELHLNDMLVGEWPQRVAEVTLSVGEFVQPGATVVRVSSLSPVVTVEFVPSDRARVAPGDAVRVDSPNGEAFEGVLGTIDDVPRSLEDGSLVYGGQVELEERPELPEGVQVRITVVIARAADVLTVPLASVVSGQTGGPAVRVLQDDETTLIDVELGLTSGAWVEVRSGLDGDETVVVAGS
jgi:peptidoglycan hydrolase-like protein with peptidoglycan-binding domain